jgi:predicted DNA binding protein
MAVILELSVAPDDLEIGRVLALSPGQSVQLESLVPTGGEIIPFVRVRGVDPAAFEATVRDDPRVDTVERFSRESDEALFAFDWRLEDEPLFDAIDAAGGYVLDGGGAADAWQFRIRFPDQAAVAEFDGMLGGASIAFDVTTLYQETAPSPGHRFGLTSHQREALVAAVEAGYFDIPRNVTASALAAEFDISDQAFIERLRRAVSNLSENTVMVESIG